MIEALTWALALDPAKLKWPAAVLVALCFGLVLFGLVQYQAFNRLWGLHLVLGLAGGAVVAGLGAASHWLLGVLYGVGYALTWLVWVLTRHWRWWRRALARGLTAGLVLGPWLWLGATEKARLARLAGAASDTAKWLLAPTGLIWFWMTLGALWLLVLVGGWGCWRAAMPEPRRAWRRWMPVAAWAVLGVLGLNWYAAGRVNLWAACEERQHWRLAYVLVSRPGSQWYRDLYGSTPLHRAAAYGNAKSVRLLLDAGADIHGKNTYGWTPLHSVAASGNEDTLRLLLTAGAAVHAKDKYGQTPLLLLAAKGTAEALGLLLAAGADVNAKANNGQTPLHSAAVRGRAEALRLLLAAGAEVNAKANNGQTPLHRAAASGNEDTLRLLLAAGADVNARDNDGWTPLHAAAGNGQAEAIRLLLAAGAHVNERNARGETALDLATKDECRQLLRQAGGKSGAELDADKAKPTP